MKTISLLGDTTDLSPSKDLPGLMVFKKSKRLAWVFTILFLLYVADLIFGSLEFKFSGEHILAFIFLSAALVLGSKRHQMIFDISTQTIQEETGYWPFAIKKKSFSFDEIQSIELIKEIRSKYLPESWNTESKISFYVVKMILHNKTEIGLKLFRNPAKGKEYLNYISSKLSLTGDDQVVLPQKVDLKGALKNLYASLIVGFLLILLSDFIPAVLGDENAVLYFINLNQEGEIIETYLKDDPGFWVLSPTLFGLGISFIILNFYRIFKKVYYWN